MKPRTKLQFRVVSLSSQLPDIESMMAEWANNDCLDHIGYATKSRIICMECGERFSAELVKRKRAVCPHCGASLKIEWSRKRTNKQFIRIGKADEPRDIFEQGERGDEDENERPTRERDEARPVQEEGAAAVHGQVRAVQKARVNPLFCAEDAAEEQFDNPAADRADHK